MLIYYCRKGGDGVQGTGGNLSRYVRELLASPAAELELVPEQGEADNEMAIARALIKKASTGDLHAIKEVISLSESEPEAGRIFEMPARLLAEPYVAVWRDIKNKGHTEYVLYGGRGSAKSTFISLMVIDLLLSDNSLHAVLCRRVKDTLRDSVYAQMKWALSELRLEEDFECRVNPMEIVYKPTGQKIYFRGADDPAKLKSIKVPFGYIGILWFEELDQWPA